MGVLDGKVAVVTGAGRGIGRGEALALARHGASVVVNDFGGSWDGRGRDDRPAVDVVREITAAGGRAVANFDSVIDADGAEGMVAQAIDAYGRLDILVNNAGILCDGMVFSIDPEDWWSVVKVHLMGHFLPTRAAAAYWRQQSKAGDAGHRAIVNTTSESGLFGNAGQSNYDAAKMGVVSFTMAVARETAKYGVTVNAVAPRARTRLTMQTFEGSDRAKEFSVADKPFDAMDPENIAPFVVFLASDAATDITAQTFIVYGGAVGHVKMPHVSDILFKAGRWTVDELVDRADELFNNLGRDAYEGPRGYARLPKQ
ncbi:SDR family oxidoreductase [Mycobacterium sp. Y57]|uniref:SDR family NAD(P)-dependent oxidoreductase n=1 Tax=Mycolicibacterium xanthum TaxID=2796469 RepID=UPI001C8638AE|nr:SDR family NAD(P)-dependent oxidoreductase [Mycolicibacterium xanthum]MBX7430530.1 SDR family oxidoreductase [Mycolicibacterium xanthum]